MLTCSYHAFPIWRCYDSGMTWDDDPWDQLFFHVHLVRLNLLTMATLRLNIFFLELHIPPSITTEPLINQQSGWIMGIALIKPFRDHFSHEPSLSSFQKNWKTVRSWSNSSGTSKMNPVAVQLHYIRSFHPKSRNALGSATCIVQFFLEAYAECVQKSLMFTERMVISWTMPGDIPINCNLVHGMSNQLNPIWVWTWRTSQQFRETWRNVPHGSHSHPTSWISCNGHAHRSERLPGAYVFSRVFNRPKNKVVEGFLKIPFLVLPDPRNSRGKRPWCTTCILDKIEYTEIIRRPLYILFGGDGRFRTFYNDVII